MDGIKVTVKYGVSSDDNVIYLATDRKDFTKIVVNGETLRMEFKETLWSSQTYTLLNRPNKYIRGGTEAIAFAGDDPTPPPVTFKITTERRKVIIPIPPEPKIEKLEDKYTDYSKFILGKNGSKVEVYEVKTYSDGKREERKLREEDVVQPVPNVRQIGAKEREAVIPDSTPSDSENNSEETKKKISVSEYRGGHTGQDKKVTVIAKRLGGLGETFEYEAGDWKILSLEGVDAPTIELFHTPRGKGDGDILTGYRLHPRLITIKARLANFMNYSVQRRNCMRFHDVRAKYQLIIKYLDNTVLTGDCSISAISYPTENINESPELTIGFLAMDPGLYSRDEKKLSFSQTVPMWHVTRAYGGEQGSLPFSYIKTSNKLEIEYNGTDSVGFTINLRFSKRSQNLNVKLNNKTLKLFAESEFVFKEGQKVVIDSVNKKGKWEDRSFTPKELRKIPFDELKLSPGFNSIELIDDIGAEVNATIEMVYRERFLSI